MFSLLLAVNHIAFYGATSLPYSPFGVEETLLSHLVFLAPTGGVFPVGAGNVACCGVQ